jgi:translocator protein
MKTVSVLALAGFVAASFVAAAMGMVFPPGDWYRQLVKPRWRPPDQWFAPVWTVLYLSIAASGWMVWREAGFTGAALPLSIFFVQLLLNAAWTPIFFGLRRPGWGLYEIALLWISIIATIASFSHIHRGAAWLLLPYLAWVTFAAALNFAICRLNRAPGSGTRVRTNQR